MTLFPYHLYALFHPPWILVAIGELRHTPCTPYPIPARTTSLSFMRAPCSIGSSRERIVQVHHRSPLARK